MQGKTNVAGVGRLKGSVLTFVYTGAVQTFIAPATATYEIECAGAASSGKGSIAKARVDLKYREKLYVYVGSGTFNGGGSASSASGEKSTSATGTAGGGASDVRAIESSASDGWSGTESLQSRLITAGGGGGSGSGRGYGVWFEHTTDDDGYNHCYRHYDYYSYGNSAINSESGNGTLGQGRGSSSSVSYNDNAGKHTHDGGTEDNYIRGEQSGWAYEPSVTPAGGGGWYGGASKYAGTSYINDGYEFMGRTLAFEEKSISQCSNSTAGYVKITCIG